MGDLAGGVQMKTTIDTTASEEAFVPMVSESESVSKKMEHKSQRTQWSNGREERKNMRGSNSSPNLVLIVVLISSLVVAGIIVAVIGYFCWKRHGKAKAASAKSQLDSVAENTRTGSDGDDKLDLPVVTLT